VHLQSEIYEQPDVIARILAEQSEKASQIAEKIRAFNPTFVTIAARGTSDNAARYAQYLWGSRAKLSVGLSAPSLHTLYETPPNLARALVIGISQSGRAEDVRRVLADARSQGALTVSITNYDDSPMAQTAEYHLNLSAGEEISIAATKTYTAQLTAVALLCAHLLQDTAMLAELHQLPAFVRETLSYSDSIASWAERYRYMERFAVIGRGYNFATAFEISLKIKELTYVIGDGYSEADFQHGPIATINQGFPVIAVAPKGKTLANLNALIAKLKDKGAEVLAISNDAATLESAVKQMQIADAPEWLSPMLGVVPGQIFAMQQALVRGYAVDKPRGLSKVTVTE
jgi:glucosamine--fructose-6-phosphate aminotransferase (isomerizing)